MTPASIFVAGLPNAGKTTFLAALWHLLQSGELQTALTYDGLEGIDVKYLNTIKGLWLEHKPMDRTKPSQEQLAKINLKTRSGDRIILALPDFAGEGFRRMWEARRATTSILTSANQADGHLLLVNAEKIVYPRTVDEYRAELAALQLEPGEELPFDPRKCPTAAILADVVNSLERSPIEARPKRFALALTAWDAVRNEGLTPQALLDERLSLVSQMIESRSRDTEFRVFGVSAQGLSYDNTDGANLSDIPSERIQVIEGDEEHHDLTKMLEWLLV